MNKEEREALKGRVSKGFDVLRDLEDRGDTGPKYERWFEAWEKLLRAYEEEVKE